MMLAKISFKNVSPNSLARCYFWRVHQDRICQGLTPNCLQFWKKRRSLKAELKQTSAYYFNHSVDVSKATDLSPTFHFPTRSPSLQPRCFFLPAFRDLCTGKLPGQSCQEGLAPPTGSPWRRGLSGGRGLGGEAMAWLLRGVWDLPRPVIEPRCPALAGGFLSTAPPGRSLKSVF